MYLRKFLPALAIIALITLINIPVIAQEKKIAPTSQSLFNEIAHMDSVLFNAFNTQNMNLFKPLFTEDLEWYQDNGGLIPYKIVFDNFENTFKKEFKLTRQLVKSTLEVHPLKDYGAIETGTHQFRHIENGKEEVGTFKFLMIWRKTGDSWKISRVVSYDH
ncbi:MAG: nuclear transport factor 2 family protein [Ferruginibacter sp.]